MAYLTGAAETAFGRLEGSHTLGLMAEAARDALGVAGLGRTDVDGLLCGYSTAMAHIMPANLFAEYFGLDPLYCHGVVGGGATGALMAALAMRLAEAGQCRHTLVVAGDNRLSGVGTDATVRMLARVGHADFEQPLGPSVPALYALATSRYMHEYGADEADLAALAVLMRSRAADNPKAHMRAPITEAGVLASRPIAEPLKLLDCCPVSDGAVAFVVSAEPVGGPAVRLAGAGQAHKHQHVSAAKSLSMVGAAEAARRALDEAGIALADIAVAGIYDPFTITLMVFLEELGFAGRGEAAAMARAGAFDPGGALPLNTHGGLLSFGHSGVAGGMAHIAEVYRQLAGDTGMVDGPIGFVHAEGGIMSANVSLVLIRE